MERRHYNANIQYERQRKRFLLWKKEMGRKMEKMDAVWLNNQKIQDLPTPERDIKEDGMPVDLVAGNDRRQPIVEASMERVAGRLDSEREQEASARDQVLGRLKQLNNYTPPSVHGQEKEAPVVVGSAMLRDHTGKELNLDGTNKVPYTHPNFTNNKNEGN
ncbi:hypothetical protein D1007_26555 [Hordeum vulgare]|nr:hypothetical protein D1007_26555 [Hordeum vulgare]